MELITDKIKTLDDVSAALNIDLKAIATGINALPIPDGDKAYLVNHYNWTKITEALNEGWVADYTNWNQDKYWPYGYQAKKNDKDPSGFGFSRTRAYWTVTSTYVGARLSFKTSALAIYAITQFPEIYKGCHLEKVEAAS